MFVPFSTEICDCELSICGHHSSEATFGLSMVVWAVEILQTPLGNIMLEGRGNGEGNGEGEKEE